MKYYGKITDNKDLVTKEYVDRGKLPEVTTSDNGKFLRVVSGIWSAVVIANAEDHAFGGN